MLVCRKGGVISPWVALISGSRGGGLHEYMVHIYMLCIYVGKTTVPPIQRLRKHATTGTACVEYFAFNDLLRLTDLHE